MSPRGYGSIGRRLWELEREVQRFYRELRLDDGTVVRYIPEEELAALSAVIDEEDHWLLPHLRRVSPDEGTFPVSLIQAIEESRKKLAEEEE